MKHSTIYYAPGVFAAWPANGGIWNWGDEILVCFAIGRYREYPDTHCIDRDSPIEYGLARSLDGGETWSVDTDPEINRVSRRRVVPLPPTGLPFGDAGFALKVGTAAVTIKSTTFVVTRDRGVTWEGPYALPGADATMTSRTDYIVHGPGSCTLFLSHAPTAEERMTRGDRVFAWRTDDGARSWTRLGYLTSDEPRAVMPSTVLLADGRFISALRRRLDSPATRTATNSRNWIEIRESTDGGRSWSFVSEAADTGGKNGNPPAMAQTTDGRLVLAYGYRGDRPSIKARISDDAGRTWGEEIILRDGARMHDIGYPRMVVRTDGTVVTVYYFTTAERPEQHICATTWDVPR